MKQLISIQFCQVALQKFSSSEVRLEEDFLVLFFFGKLEKISAYSMFHFIWKSEGNKLNEMWASHHGASEVFALRFQIQFKVAWKTKRNLISWIIQRGNSLCLVVNSIIMRNLSLLFGFEQLLAVWHCEEEQLRSVSGNAAIGNLNTV